VPVIRRLVSAGDNELMASKSRILVVADEPRTQRFLEAHLNAHGYLTSHASDERSTVAAVRQERPNLVLVDMTMSQHRGVEILERFGETPFEGIPVLALVGAGRNADGESETELAEAIGLALGSASAAHAAA
jgi:CheY-like chemotaxis protein